MPYNDSVSPRRLQLSERTASSQSISRASPTAGHHIKTLSHKKHTPHAVGHHRHSHNRISSYGKNLNKLSKLTSVQSTDERAQPKQHARTLSSSPTSIQMKRNSSNVSLPRAGSKVSIPKNSSIASLKRSVAPSAAKPRSRPNSRNGNAGEVPSRGRAKFSVGEEDQDDEWVAASTSQSPDMSRRGSKTPKPPQLEEPPSPDDPQGPSPPVLPHSPPQSPPIPSSEIANQVSADRAGHHAAAPHPQPPHLEAVTNRLLSRHRSPNAAPQMSSISATMTPSGSSGSPGHDVGLSEPSMPADGISRFLNHTESSSGSVTPGSIPQIQSALASIRRTHHQHDRGSHLPSPASSPVSGNLEAIRHAKSTGNLANPHGPAEGIGQSVSPPHGVPAPTNTRASPFKSANEPREAARSMTQLKLDLQRISSNREPTQPPSVHPPSAMIHGAYAMAGMASAVSGELSRERRIRQYEQAGLEFRNARRFNNMLTSGMGRLEKRREKRKSSASTTTITPKGVLAAALEERDEDKTRASASTSSTATAPAPAGPSVGGAAAPSSSSSSAATASASGRKATGGRGRVRFEIGRKEAEGENEEEGGAREEDEGGGGGGAAGGVQALLKRIWEVQLGE